MADASGDGLHVAIAYDCLYPVNTGGGERVYRRMAELLTERGCAVSYVTRRQWANGEEPLSDFRIIPVWRGAIYDSSGARTPRTAIGFALGLFRHFRTHRRDYDMVVVSALPVLNVFAVKLALLGTRTVTVSDWLEVWTWRKWREYSGLATGTAAFVLQLLAVRLTTEQTVNSAFTRRNLMRYRHNASPVVLELLDLVNGPRSASTQRTGEPFALFAGRHIPDKRLPHLPPALAAARKIVPTLRLVVTGVGPDTARAKEVARAVGVSDAIDFVGRVSDEELQQLFSTASVLVNPSSREGFGLVIAEAASAGTPSVVVNGPDNAAVELIEIGVNGTVAESPSSTDLAVAIGSVVLAGEELRRTTLDWYISARETHNLAASVDELLRRYDLRAARRRD